MASLLPQHPFITVCCAALASACSSPDNGALRGGTPGAGDAVGMEAGAGASPSFGGAGSGAAPGIGGGFNGSGVGGAGMPGVLTPDAACGATVLEPEAIETEETTEEEIDCTAQAPSPVSLYIMLDNSGSMDDDDKWEDAVDALSEFVETGAGSASDWTCVNQDGEPAEPPEDLEPPGAGAISVAIQYFHPDGSNGGRGNDDDDPEACDGSNHSTPDVPMGPIPANAGAIVDSLDDTGPNGNTPTVGALTGGTQYCAAYQQQNPDIPCVVVLVTDGQPNGCGLDSDCGGGGQGGGGDCVDPQAEDILRPIAEGAFNGSNGVMTFTVGMDGVTNDGFDLLDAIALAGGSDCTPGTAGSEACNVSSSGGQDLLDALNTIRETVQVSETATSETVTTTVTERTMLPCEWAIPDPPAGQTFDPSLVNVTLTTAGVAQALGNVESAAACANAAGGWYYEVGAQAEPERIVACPQMCDVIESLTDARIEVLLGCSTVPAVPR